MDFLQNKIAGKKGKKKYLKEDNLKYIKGVNN